MQIFVRKPQGNTITLNVEKNETIRNVKRKLKEKEGIHGGFHLVFIYNGELLEDGHTVAHCNILNGSTLHLFLSLHTLVETWTLYIKTWNKKEFSLEVNSVDTIDDVKAKIQVKEGIPLHTQLLFRYGKWLEDGSRTAADYGIRNCGRLQLVIQCQQGRQPNVSSQGKPLPPCRTSEQATLSTPPPQHVKRPRTATQATPTKAAPNSHSILDTSDGEATAAPGGVMPEIRAHPPSSVLTELEDLKREMATARSKEKELEATITELTRKNKELSSQMVCLKDETKEELTLARNKGKELEAIISVLTHKSKVFSDQCASYESQVVDLEIENKKTKEELMNAEKKYYSGARAAGYAEGLQKGKAKWLKSVEFLHHLTDASIQYFDYGFNSCEKQAKQQGFVGQLNKDSALKEAPKLKGWESSDRSYISK